MKLNQQRRSKRLAAFKRRRHRQPDYEAIRLERAYWAHGGTFVGSFMNDLLQATGPFNLIGGWQSWRGTQERVLEANKTKQEIRIPTSPDRQTRKAIYHRGRRISLS